MITRPTTAAAASGIGWLNGMASQLSLPNMLVLRPWRYARIRPPALWAGSGRQLLSDDLVEQRGIRGAEGERTDVHALPGQRGVAFVIEGWAGAACGSNPGVKPLRRYCLHVEMHARETVATEVARQAKERAWFVRAQVQLRRHAVHRVDHAAELWDEERTHHARR